MRAVAGTGGKGQARKGAPVLITGGSGFIGSNLADSLLCDGHEVIILDNLSRPGVEQNLDWLRKNHGRRVHFERADIAKAGWLPAVAQAGAVFHLAAQTAVTTSLADPLADFEVNARGTINVLEAVRRTGRRIPVIFASTNKVYGGLADLAMRDLGDRYAPETAGYAEHGVGEDRPLDFCTPYGCSKGVADQYVLDYAKSFGIPTAVLRMSCIYGPRQFGTEDQGWVAHFLLRALRREPIALFGDGKQVRDILHVVDAVAAYRAVLDAIETVHGEVFNLGGGPKNAISLRLLLNEIERIVGRKLDIDRADWRKGDQLYFVADTRKLERTVGWRPTVAWRAGVAHLAEWLAANRPVEAAERMRIQA